MSWYKVKNMKMIYVIKKGEDVKVSEKEFSTAIDCKMNEICATCGYTRVAHEMKGIYTRRAKLSGDRKTMKILKEICNDFKLGDVQ